MAIDPHLQIRQKFDEIVADVKRSAARQTALLINSIELEKLTPEEKVRYLYEKSQTVSNEIDNFETLEYYFFANDENILFKIFSFRILCNERNEEQNLRDGFLLFEKYRQVNHHLLKAKKQLSPFTFKDLLSNKWNEVFFGLDEQPFGTTDKDYLLMRYYQIKKKACGTAREFGVLRENFLAALDTRKDTRKQVRTEIKQLEYIYNNLMEWTPGQLSDELAKLKGLKNLSTPKDMEAFHGALCSVMKGDKMNWMLSPRFFSSFDKDLKERKISNPVIFGLTLIMYFRWLSDILIGKLEMYVKPNYSFTDLFYKTLEEGSELGRIALDKFKKMHCKEEMSNEQYMAALNEEYKQQCTLFRELVYPDYFYFFDTIEKVKFSFINDCLYSVNIELPVGELKHTIMLNEMIAFLIEEMSLITHNPLACMVELPFDKLQMIELLFYMAPDTAQIRQLLETLSKVKVRCHNKRVPVCFIMNELSSSFTHLFKIGVEKYIQAIGRLDTDKRGCFILDQIKEIKYNCRLNEIGNSKLIPFYKYLKHLSKDELKNIQGLRPYKRRDVSELFKIKEAVPDKPFSFGYHQGPKELKPILKAMFLKMNMLTNGSTVDDLWEVFTCKDLSKNKTIIYIGFTTIKFAYFRKKVEQWFYSFTPALIEKSGIFISQNQEPITAHVLYNSKAILLEDSNQMDEIFDAKY